MDENLIKKLTAMQDKITKAKKEKDSGEAVIKSIMSDLKEQYQIDTLDQLSKEIDEIEDKMNKIESELETGIAELEKNYEWN